MGNGLAKFTHCFSGGGGGRRRHIAAAVTSEPYEEGLGHSFCYVRPEIPPTTTVSELLAPTEESTTFRSISGASVSANASTPLSTCLLSELTWPAAAAFDCSTSFASVPLHPIPRSGPLGFLSGPIDRERGFMSGPLAAGLFSGPLADRPPISGPLRRSLSHAPRRTRRAASSLVRGLTRAIARTVTWHGSIVAPVKCPKESAGHISSQTSIDDGAAAGGGGAVDSSSSAAADSGNLQWAQGKAGEDRVHVVISEEYGWVFVGIYDGFNGPDATDYLLSNLYPAVHRELKGLLWEENHDSENTAAEESDPSIEEGHPKLRSSRSQRRWKCDWDRERLELDKKLKEQLSKTSSGDAVNHQEVLEALSKALRKTEDAYMDVADKMASENPELALMGSCVLVMLMKGEDVYLMNVGDSRAVLAQNELDLDFSGTIRKARQDLERISEEAYWVDDQMGESPCLAALQLTLDHSTSEEEEVCRIKSEHPDDASAIANDRVKGSLKVTRAFGAGFLKQPKWNEALLEVFRIHYVGTSPYITCNPYLYHHKLGPRDKFLILSSDGLYQYFTNEEAVTEVEYFIATTPEGDPAQHLVEEVLFRAANKAGMDFYELLEIPQGDRRRYHDDVSIIVISFEGRIWRSCV